MTSDNDWLCTLADTCESQERLSEPSIRRLRLIASRLQADLRWIGGVLELWDQLPNDLKSDDGMEGLSVAIEEMNNRRPVTK